MTAPATRPPGWDAGARDALVAVSDLLHTGAAPFRALVEAAQHLGVELTAGQTSPDWSRIPHAFTETGGKARPGRTSRCATCSLPVAAPVHSGPVDAIPAPEPQTAPARPGGCPCALWRPRRSSW